MDAKRIEAALVEIADVWGYPTYIRRTHTMLETKDTSPLDLTELATLLAAKLGAPAREI